jgi:hypothetical protein
VRQRLDHRWPPAHRRHALRDKVIDGIQQIVVHLGAPLAITGI